MQPPSAQTIIRRARTVSSSEYFYRLNGCINFNTKHCIIFFFWDDDDDEDFKHTDYSADAASEIGYAVAGSNNTHFTFHLN